MKRKKAGGRQAGTPNKSTKEVRQFINDLLADQNQNIIDALEKLYSKGEYSQYLSFIAKLLPYVAPKIKQVAHYAGQQEMNIRIFRTNSLIDDDEPAQEGTYLFE